MGMKYFIRNPYKIAGVYYMDSLVYGQLSLMEVLCYKIRLPFEQRKLGHPKYGALDEVSRGK